MTDDAATDVAPATSPATTSPATTSPATAGGLRRRLAEGGPLLGALLRLPAETLVEMVAIAGMDCVLLDLEHGATDLVSVQHHVMAAQLHGVPTLARVGADEPALVLRCLDLGVAGIVFPHVTSVEDARRAVAAAHYPPLGERGFAAYSRAGRYGATPSADHLDAGADTLVIVMIEDTAGCAASADILAVDGVDGVFVGPADLSVALGLRGDAQHPDVLAARRDVHEAAAKASRAVIMIVSSPESAVEALDAGASLVLYNTAAVLTDTLRRLAAPRRPSP